MDFPSLPAIRALAPPLAVSLALSFALGSHLPASAQSLAGLQVLANASPDLYHMHQIAPARTFLSDLSRDLGHRHSFHTDFRWVHPDTLSRYQVLVWAVGRPDSVPVAGRAHVEAFLARGGSLVLIHTALQRFGDWQGWNLILGGTEMDGHPAPQSARNVREDAEHPITRSLPAEWRATDENYALSTNPRGRNGNRILLALDEKSYSPGTFAMGDHPSAWVHETRGGRVFVTLSGHNQGTWTQDANFRTLIRQALVWAAEPHLKPSALALRKARPHAPISRGRSLALPASSHSISWILTNMRGQRVRRETLPAGVSGEWRDLPTGLHHLTAQGPGATTRRTVVLP